MSDKILNTEELLSPELREALKPIPQEEIDKIHEQNLAEFHQKINTITLSPGRTGQEVDSQTTETIPMPVVATTSTGMIDVIINGARIKNPG
jgi:hypothetical protein